MVSLDPGVEVFDGPGPVRELIRAIDWSANPLGPVRSWSPVLRTMTRGCLASSFPMVIHWGPQRVALYNDAFAVLLGGKHPAALGRPAKDTWPEAWDVVGGRLDDVDGSTAGVFTVCTETTAKVLHERRMRVVRELGVLSITDAGSPAETCRAVLRVLASARETMPFAVAFLREDGDPVRMVADYGVAPDASVPGLTDPGPDSAAPIHRVLASGQVEEVT